MAEDVKGKQVIGFRNLHYAVLTQDNLEGATWGTPVSMGTIAKEFKEKANSSDYAFRADMQIVASGNKKESKELDLVVSYLVPALRAAITDEEYDDATGLSGCASNGEVKPIALMYEKVHEDGTSEYKVYYKVTFTIEEDEVKGDGDKVEEYPVNLKGTATPLIYKINGKNFIDRSIQSDDKATGAASTIENWFKAVQLTGTEKPATAQTT